MGEQTGNGSGGTAGPAAAPAPARRRAGLSWKLLTLTVLYVMVSEVLIYVPSIANFRISRNCASTLESVSC